MHIMWKIFLLKTQIRLHERNVNEKSMQSCIICKNNLNNFNHLQNMCESPRIQNDEPKKFPNNMKYLKKSKMFFYNRLICTMCNKIKGGLPNYPNLNTNIRPKKMYTLQFIWPYRLGGWVLSIKVATYHQANVMLILFIGYIGKYLC